MKLFPVAAATALSFCCAMAVAANRPENTCRSEPSLRAGGKLEIESIRRWQVETIRQMRVDVRGMPQTALRRSYEKRLEVFERQIDDFSGDFPID